MVNYKSVTRKMFLRFEEDFSEGITINIYYFFFFFYVNTICYRCTFYDYIEVTSHWLQVTMMINSPKK